MRRFCTVLLLAAAACGPRTPSGVDQCTDVLPVPAACAQACNAAPGNPNTCPDGFYCTPDGVCGAVCTPTGNECGDGFRCTSDGHCVATGSGDPGTMPDAACPAVHYTPTLVTPSIELVLDRSGSMDTTDISPTRFEALHEALTGSAGALTQRQSSVYFGAALFASDEAPCLTMTGYTAPRALNNRDAIDNLIVHNPPNGGNTPTTYAIQQITADYALNPPPSGSPPIILLATDGEPNSCAGEDSDPIDSSIAAVAGAEAVGIKTYIIGLAGLETSYLQSIANAGVGAPLLTNAPYYTASSPTQLVAGIDSIIDGALSCDLTLTGTIDTSQASSGTLTLNGVTLTYGTDWTLDANGMTIHVLGTACTTLKASPNPVIDASFPCGAVIQ